MTDCNNSMIMTIVISFLVFLLMFLAIQYFLKQSINEMFATGWKKVVGEEKDKKDDEKLGGNGLF